MTTSQGSARSGGNVAGHQRSTRRLARCWRFVVCLIAEAVLLSSLIPTDAASLTPLGGLPGGHIFSEALALSANGDTVVGFSYSSPIDNYEAFRWTRNTGMVRLENIPAGTVRLSYGVAVSADGSVVVGYGDFGESEGVQAFRWTKESGLVGLGFLTERRRTYASAISGDGSVVVGYGESLNGVEAFRWTATGGIQGLGDLPAGDFRSAAHAVSTDGRVIVGSGHTGTTDEAVLWHSDGSIEALGHLPGGLGAYAHDVSADGQVVVGIEGMSRTEVLDEAFRWTRMDGMISLGHLAQEPRIVRTLSVSADGKIIVGAMGDQAFVWTLKRGMQSIWDILKSAGVDPAGDGWTSLLKALDVSDDGRFVAGFGERRGNHEAFVADLGTVPEAPVAVTTIAGSGTAGYLDASDPLQAQFDQPNSPAVNRDGVIFVPDAGSHTIRFITPSGTVGTWAGQTVKGFHDGPANEALFHTPLAVTLDAAGDLLVADADNHRVRRIVSAGVRTVTTVAGSGTPGLKDGPAPQAAFNFPNDLVVDSAGNIFVIEFSNHTVRKIARNGEVSTFAGSGAPGYKDARGTAAQFYQPAGITIDRTGNFYVTEWGNHRVRKIQPDGTVTTLAGSGVAGFKDGLGTAAQLNIPDGITADADGTLYLTEVGNHAVRRISPGGYVSTVAGLGTPGFADGDQATAQFNHPTGITLDVEGRLIVTDVNNRRIRRIDLAAAPPPPPKGPLLSLDLTSALTIYGLPGETYRIEYADAGQPSNWIALTNLTLTKPVEKWADPRPATRARRFYRAVLQ